jgi:two-component system KDP operon response regulator KdpE
MKTLSILVIEDEPGIVRVLEPTLTATGAAVKIAWDGREATGCLKSGGYDLVLCDLGLPDVEGHELVAKIREGSDIPIIVLSAQEDVDLDHRRVVLEEEEIKLSAREHSLLALLAESPDGVATHQQIINRVWGPNARAETQSVRVLVGQLRQKLEEDPSNPRILQSEPGVGYRLGSA